MRDPAELLAMLCPKGLQVGQPFGGIPRLTALDIAGACGMGHMTRPQAQLIWIKYCLEAQHFDPLRYWWSQQVVDKAADSKWRTERGKPRILTMATYTLIEHLQYNLCTQCCGRGEFHLEGQSTIVCPDCDGSGRHFPSGRYLAELLELDEAAYRRTWAPRFGWCRRRLQIMEHDALAVVRCSLS